MTTPAGTISFNDVNAEMGLSPRVISATYRYVNLLERHNPAEVAWSRLRNQSRIWDINDDMQLSFRTYHSSPLRGVSQFFPNVLPGDAFVLECSFICNWGNNRMYTQNWFTYGRMTMDNPYVIGSKATYECRARYDGGDTFYAVAWQSGSTKSRQFYLTAAVNRLIYLPAIPNPP